MLDVVQIDVGRRQSQRWCREDNKKDSDELPCAGQVRRPTSLSACADLERDAIACNSEPVGWFDRCEINDVHLIGQIRL